MKSTDRTNCTSTKAIYPFESDKDSESLLNEMQFFTDPVNFFTDRLSIHGANELYEMKTYYYGPLQCGYIGQPSRLRGRLQDIDIQSKVPNLRKFLIG